MATSTRGRNGILPIPAAATRKSTKPEVPGRQLPKANSPRLRLIIRRLPPGLTETEFWATLGEEWKSGLTKVEWAAYKPGKLSREYVHLPNIKTHAKSLQARLNPQSHQGHI